MIQHLRTAFKHIRRSPYQAISASLIMTITFFVATVLAIIAFASHSLLNYFETRPQVIAFLNNEASAEQVSGLQSKLGTDVRVKDVRYVSKEQALEIYREATSDKPLLSELVSPKVFPASIEFSVSDLNFADELVKELQSNEIVKEVAFTASLGSAKDIGNVVANLRRITDYIRIGGLVILSFLLVSSLMILLVILGMRISIRRDEIQILQLIGATSSFIRAPFIFEGLIYSIIGTVVGWGLASILLLYLAPTLSAFFVNIPVLPSELLQLLTLFGAILGVELLLGILLGTAGSLIAIRRYLKV